MRISSHPRLRRFAVRTVAVLATTGLLAATAAAHAADGIDVSKWQHNPTIDWAKVKADGVDFTFIKATEGSGYTNAYLRSDWSGAKQVGIYRGAYHFARPSRGSAAKQARYFVSVAGRHGRRGDLPPVLDLEDDGGLGVTALRRWTTNWLETVEELTGRTPIIYTGPYFWESEMGNSTAFHRYPLWVAHYTTGSPRVPGGWPAWTFWQRTDEGRVSGIGGDVDINRFHGTRAQLAALAQADGGDTGTGTPGTGTTPEPEPETPTEPDPPTEPETPTEPEAPAPTATSVSLDLSRDTVFENRPVEVEGRLQTEAGRALAGKQVRLYRRADGSSTWTRIASTKTDTVGNYAVSLTASSSASFRVTFGGNRRYATSTSPLANLIVRPKVGTDVTLAVDRDTRRGNTVKLYGHLRTATGRALADRSMRVYQRPAGSSRWTLVKQSQTLAPTGWYQVYVRAARTATYKAVFRGAPVYTRSVSDLTTVRVR